MPFIQTTNICKTYATGGFETQAVCKVNLVIEPGEFVAIMGPSGSGKSTLLHTTFIFQDQTFRMESNSSKSN